MDRRDAWLLGGIIAIAAIVRFATLDLQSFHHDEAVTAGRVLQPGLPDTLRDVVEGERSPPCYYVIAWAWSKLFGTGEVGLRSLSALIGTAMVPAAFALGRELSTKRAGFIAAAVVALNPLLVWYSQEARSYILAALLVTLAMVFFARGVRRGSPLDLALWVALGGLAVFTHYFAAFVLIPLLLWMLVERRNQRAPVLACAGLVVFFAAGAALALIQQGEGREAGYRDVPPVERLGEVGLDYTASEQPDPFAAGAKVDAVQALGALGGAVALVIAGWIVVTRGSPRDRQAARWMGGTALLALGLPTLMAIAGFDFLKPRNLMIALIPVLTLLAVGFGVRRGGRLAAATAAGLCVLFGGVVAAVAISEDMQRVDWRQAAEQIEQRPDPLVVVPKNGDDPLAFYLDAGRFRGPLGERGVIADRLTVLGTTRELEPPSRFDLQSERALPPLFTVWGLAATKPVRVVRADLEGVLPEETTVLLRDP